MTTDLYNQKAEKIGTVELPERIFGRKWSSQLVHQALTAQTANGRQTLAHAKGRDEVRGGGKKPYAQKHTGRARHSSIRSPIWKGGGVAHGPSKDRDFGVKINKKMKQAALFTVLSRKFKDGEIKVVDSLTIKEPKTKAVAEFLKVLSVPKISALIVPDEKNAHIYRATRNLPKAKSISGKSLNVYDLLKYKNVILDKGAIAVIDKTYSA